MPARARSDLGQEFSGVLTSGGGDLDATEHPGNFLDAIGTLQRDNAADRAPSLLMFADRKLLVGACGDLGKVRDA